jgi:NSD Cys-His rich domain
MNCWHCDRPAHAQCKFCGRSVCRDHVKTMPHIVAMYSKADNEQMAFVTPEAVHCGVCSPLGKPIKLEGIPQ